jgi:DNA-binding PadR family transcriptional regulator
MPAKKTTGHPDESKARLDGRSPLRTAALAVLLEKPGHGYDVAHRINMRMGASWCLEAKHIYPVLEALEKAGLLRSEKDPSDRRRRRIFYPTELAEQARREWLTTPTRVTIVREDIQARLAFSSEEEVPDLLRALEAYRADLLVAIEENAVADVPTRSWLSRVMSFTRSGVDRRLMAELEWVGEVERELEEFLAERP